MGRFVFRNCYNKPKCHHVAERLVNLMYSPEDSSSLLPLNVASIFEMVVSHSAFLPTIFSNTSTEVKGSVHLLLLESYHVVNEVFLLFINFCCTK